jgi:hypothetical protein
MRRIGAAAALLAGLAFASAVLAEESPCDRLAARARQLPASVWGSDRAKALEPDLQIDSARSDLTPFEAGLVKLQPVTEALGEYAGPPVVVDRAPGTDVYALSRFEGTLHCQNVVFLRAAPGAAARLIDGPTPGEGELCYTQSGDFGRAYGQPAWIEHGAVSQTNDDEEIEIRPWAGQGWATACRLTLKFRNAYRIAERHCGDKAVCEAAGRFALDVAAAYGRWQRRGRDVPAFAYGPAPNSQARAAVRALKHGLEPASTTEFPTFGRKMRFGYSYEGFVLFPLMLNGHGYVAAIGHDGVGWREFDNTLLAIYSADTRPPRPLAGFVIPRSIGGLVSATAGPGRPLDPGK